MSFINLVSEELDTSLEDTDELLNRRNEKRLIRAVREVNLRTNGSAFHVRILVEEETALETSVDGVHARSATGSLSVSSDDVLGERRLHVGFPARVTRAGEYGIHNTTMTTTHHHSLLLHSLR